MMSSEVQSRSERLAVLIDADNTSADLIEPLLKEIAKYGTAHVKRIYGDWTKTQLNKWKLRLNEFAIQPIQQFEYTTGKNSTDSALIIDAMDLLYSQRFDGFCIVSSDSDFTRLASRIRESGLIVYGFGEKQKTPLAFIRACDRFIYTEILKQAPEPTDEAPTNGHSTTKGAASAGTSTPSAAKASQKLKTNQKLINLLKDAYEALTEGEENEWIHLGPMGSQLTKLSPSFDPRNYDCKKLSDLVEAVGIFEIEKTRKMIQIKLK
ncbi:MAG: NYN domain-containing protein [Oculatellaceae cyanobacterium Prado106]|jgi:uncharacterized LabA/DUF88 family protein|nr:NYN domain-containing protein [Oculatellaceae cyanobacterium Prado106]